MVSLQDQLEKLRGDIQRAEAPAERVAALNRLAFRLRGISTAEALGLGEEALRISRETGDDVGVAHSLLEVGFGEMAKGNLRRSLEIGYDCLHRFQSLGDPLGQIRAHSNIGLAYRSLGDLDRALEQFLAAHRIGEAIPNPSREALEMKGWFYFGQAEIQSDLKDFSSALENYQQSLQIFEELDFPVGLSRALLGIGNVHIAQGNHSEALRWLGQSLDVARGLESTVGISRTLTDIGTCHEAFGDLDSALEHNREALRHREESGYHSAALTNRINIGRILHKRSELEAARPMLESAVEEAERNQLKPKAAAAHELLSRLCEEAGDLRASLDHFQAFHRLENEVFSEESSSRVRNLQVAHKVDAAEKEAEIYRLKNVELVRLNEELQEKNEIIQEEKEKSERLLLNILPSKIVEDLRRSGRSSPEVFENVTVLFSDFVGFTERSEELEPEVLIEELNEVFTAFDQIVDRYDCERIKTIGDAYLAVCGMPRPDPNHAEKILRVGIEALEYLDERNRKKTLAWPVRIGVHSGRVVGGVVGVRKYIYDVFGDTINTASRMESLSEPMRINVSESTVRIVGNGFRFSPREAQHVKGKGALPMYFLEPR